MLVPKKLTARLVFQAMGIWLYPHTTAKSGTTITEMETDALYVYNLVLYSLSSCSHASTCTIIIMIFLKIIPNGKGCTISFFNGAMQKDKNVSKGSYQC